LKNPYSKISQDVFLFEHCPIISITNKKDLKIFNGERFENSDITEDFIEAKNIEKTKTIEIPMNFSQNIFMWHLQSHATSHKTKQLIYHIQFMNGILWAVKRSMYLYHEDQNI
jgi:hypothetical protein